MLKDAVLLYLNGCKIYSYLCTGICNNEEILMLLCNFQ